MSDKTLANWVLRARRGQLAMLVGSRRPVTELEAKVSRLNPLSLPNDLLELYKELVQ